MSGRGGEDNPNAHYNQDDYEDQDGRPIARGLSQISAPDSSYRQRSQESDGRGGVAKTGFGDHPELGGVHSLPSGGVGEAGLGTGPDVGGRLFAKEDAVALFGPLVPVGELVAFHLAALGRAVVERMGKDLAAESGPVRLGVDHVEVPGLVHLVGGGAFMLGGHAKEDELPVLVDDTFGVSKRPAVLAGQAFGEG